VGIVTGAISRLVVIDCDSEKAAKRFTENYREAKDTLKVKTGRGTHFYFVWETGIRNDAGSLLGSGIDIRGEGGYVVAPPSVHADGKTYRRIGKKKKVLPLPEALQDALLRPKKERAKSSEQTYREPFDTAQALKGVPEGERDSTIFKLTCKLRRADVPQDFAERLVLDAARKCDPPFDEDLALEKVERAYETYLPIEEDNEMDSFRSNPKGELGNETNFNPVSAGDLLSKELPEIPWLWEPYIPTGSLFLLVAYMKVGKSTFAYALITSIAQGKPFMGGKTKKGGVLILAVEEHGRDVTRRLKSFGMQPEHPIHVHTGCLSNNKKTLKAIREYVIANKIKLVLVDSLSRFWNVWDENDNARVTREVSPLLDLARETGAAIGLIHHERKSGGEGGRNIRGGSALFGLVDQALMLDHRQGGTRNQRVLKTLGRYEESPPEVIIELEGTEYRVLGTPEELNEDEVKSEIVNILRDGTPRDIKTLVNDSGHNEAIIRKAIKKLEESIITEGKGVKGSPHTYKLAPDSFLNQPDPIEESETDSLGTSRGPGQRQANGTKDQRRRGAHTSRLRGGRGKSKSKVTKKDGK